MQMILRWTVILAMGLAMILVLAFAQHVVMG